MPVKQTRWSEHPLSKRGAPLPKRVRKKRKRARRFAEGTFIAALLDQLGAMWALACVDVLRWLRMPLALASTFIPPLAMALMLVVLSNTVTKEPVALVVESHGLQALRMVQILKSDPGAYSLTITGMQDAQRLLRDQQVAAIITIPPDFDRKAAGGAATLQLTLNNADIDLADDIRRSVDRSAGRFDAPDLGAVGSSGAAGPYHISIDEQDLRQTQVDFLDYQVLPVLVLLVLNTGLMGAALLCAQDRERGTVFHLALAPLSGWMLVAGRILGGLFISLLALIPAIGICTLAGIIAPPANHWPALAALFVATALSASGMGALLGTLMRGARNIAMTASILATYLFFLGGGFTTIAFLPRWLRDISAFNPIRYAIDGMRQAMFYPDLTGFAIDIAVLVGTAAIATLIGSLAVRRSLSL